MMQAVKWSLNLPPPLMSEPHETFFASGILFAHFHLDPVGRCASGHAFWNYPSGKRWIEGCYAFGVRRGLWREYSEEGEVLSLVEFGEGEYAKSQVVPALSDIAMTPDNTLLLVEEHGFKRWLWIMDRPAADLLDWWRGLFSVEPYFYGPGPLPGTLIEVRGQEAEEVWDRLSLTGLCHRGHLHKDDDSWIESPTGEKVHCRAYDVHSFFEVA